MSDVDPFAFEAAFSEGVALSFPHLLIELVVQEGTRALCFLEMRIQSRAVNTTTRIRRHQHSNMASSSFKLSIFYDKHLYRHLLHGWSEEKIIQGKIHTLTGKTFVLETGANDFTRDLSSSSTILEVKKMLEDMEGLDHSKMELRKGKKTLKDEETLESAFVFSGNTLLLMTEQSSEFEKKEADERPDYMSTKIRMAPVISKTILLDPEEEKKKTEKEGAQEKSWWEGSSSGPASSKKKNTPSSNTHASTTDTPISEIAVSSGSVIRDEDEKDRREKRLAAIEARYGRK